MTEKAAHTTPNTSVSYRTQYPDWSEFGLSPNGHIYVAQGTGGISSDGKPIHSDGFAQCSGLIIKNVQTLESALSHIDDIGLKFEQTAVVGTLVRNYVASLKLSDEEQAELSELVTAATRYWNPMSFGDRDYNSEERQHLKDRMTKLNQDGLIKACFVRGDVSRDVKHRVIESLFDYLGINNVDEILVKTGQMHWDLAFKPEEATILVNARKQKKVLSYSF